MRAAIDHVGIPAEDPEAAGNFLAWVLGEGTVIPDGPPEDAPGDMYSLVLDGWSLTFLRTARPHPLHLAIRVAPETFRAAITRLTQHGLPFGNDPEAPTNGRTDDPLGTLARTYFHDTNKHLYELVTPTAPT